MEPVDREVLAALGDGGYILRVDEQHGQIVNVGENFGPYYFGVKLLMSIGKFVYYTREVTAEESKKINEWLRRPAVEVNPEA
jgi:hypothetical protein